MKYENKMTNNYDKKFHPDMANMQKSIDRQTNYPIDMSSCPSDADHNFYHETDFYQIKAPNKVKKKSNSSKIFSMIRKILSQIKRWLNKVFKRVKNNIR